MTSLSKHSIPDLLLSHISCELVMAIEEALGVAAQRAYMAAQGMDKGHLPHVIGQLRHFHMNESFHRALKGMHRALKGMHSASVPDSG